MKYFEKQTKINCNVEKLFDFHTDSANIKIITPPNIKVQLLNKDTTTYEKKIVKIKTTKFFIPTYWEVEIRKLQRPDILIDIALKSPFKIWIHKHIFTAVDENNSILEDKIEFKMPFGFLGRIIEPLIFKDISNMFDYRHKKTKEFLEKLI
jgi:ligand-binding SRPBCC domain-containing protein